MDGGLGLPISRNGVSTQPQPRLSNWTSSSNGLPKLPGGPAVIEEPFKKVKKPSPQSQLPSRSSTPTPSNNGVSRTEGDKKQGGEGRGMAASTSFKSLSDSSSADTTESKVRYKVNKHEYKCYIKGEILTGIFNFDHQVIKILKIFECCEKQWISLGKHAFLQRFSLQ